MGGIAALNPFRYRGYYWDEEIALYYLNARYYDPEVGRFISQDDIFYLKPIILNGVNLYSYCYNNPIKYIDVVGFTPQVNIGVDIWTLYKYEKIAWYSGRYTPTRQYIPSFDLSAIGNNLLLFGEEILSGFDLRVGTTYAEFISVKHTGFTVASIGYTLFDLRYNVNDTDYVGLTLGTLKLEAFDFSFGGAEGVKINLIDVQATLATVGVYSEYVDAELLIGSYGMTAKFDNGALTLGISKGIGFKITIRFW